MATTDYRYRGEGVGDVEMVVLLVFEMVGYVINGIYRPFGCDYKWLALIGR